MNDMTLWNQPEKRPMVPPDASQIQQAPLGDIEETAGPDVWVEGAWTNGPKAPPKIEGPPPWEPPQLAGVAPEAATAGKAAAGGIGAAALGAGAGVVAAQAAVASIETLGEAIKSPQGSIGAFTPSGGGGGGGQDYAGQALNRAILAALNKAASIPTRY